MRIHRIATTAVLALALLAGGSLAQDKGVGNGDILFKNVVIHTATGTPAFTGDLLVEGGRIKTIGTVEGAPEGVRTVDGGGKLHITPGIIDCHSHIANSGGLNESTEPVTPEVRVLDVINHEDRAIYRALAGGTTGANILHGSANVIGGQNAVIKLRWGASPEGLINKNAPRGVKFALGENPKRSNSSGSRAGNGYPRTRMGVEMILRRAFTEAQEYKAEHARHRELVAAGKRAVPPRRDLRMEALVDILEGDILVHCHCYRADEILMLLRFADDFGIRIQTLQHVLEGYKVAREIASHGAGASTFSDWWAYKAEAFDAIPYNAELMRRAGVLVSINSDSSDFIRRLNLEAAKCVKYGDYPRDLALQLVTLNPAKQLAIDKWTGSLEVGKDGDIAVWNGDPLDTASTCQLTVIDGRVFFDRAKDLAARGGRDLALTGAAPKKEDDR